MRKIKKTTLKVVSKNIISEGIIRLTSEFVSPAQLGSKSKGDYIKLCLQGEDSKSLLRTLTIADIDVELNTLSIDFVKHEGSGPAAKFIKNIEEGAEFSFMGPGPGKKVSEDCKCYFLLADRSAFAAMKAQVEILLNEDNDKEINLIFDSSLASALDYFGGLLKDKRVTYKVVENLVEEQRLVNEIKKFDLEHIVSKALWCAGERLSAKAVRLYLKENKNIEFKSKYISSYWQKGVNESEHKSLKRND